MTAHCLLITSAWLVLCATSVSVVGQTAPSEMTKSTTPVQAELDQPASGEKEARNTTQQPASRVDEPQTTKPGSGLWPSPKITDLLLTRWADQFSRQFGLSEDQNQKARQAMVDRWGRYLRENREKIEPLINDFLEMRLELEPPSREQVQSWSKRALPVLDQTQEQVQQGANDFRAFLNPQQLSRFDSQMLQFGVGLRMARNRLEVFKDGEFDPADAREFWRAPRARAPRQQSPDANKKTKKSEAAADKKLDPIELELDAWRQYAEAFVLRYELVEGQRDTVRSILADVTEQARNHRTRYRHEIDRLERRIEHFNGSEKELSELKRLLADLYGPIDRMFADFKARIDEIPTAVQKAKFAQREAQRTGKSENTPPSKNGDNLKRNPEKPPN